MSENVMSTLSGRNPDDIGKVKKKAIPKTPAEKTADILLWGIRALLIVDIVLLFFPSFNPARICEKINKNMSLFTCGIAYDTLVSNLGRAFTKGWVEQSTFRLLFGSSTLSIFAALFYAVGGCMSLGSNKMKKIAAAITGGGTILMLGCLFGISKAHGQVLLTNRPEKVLPYETIPYFTLFMVITIVLLALCLAVFFLLPSFAKAGKMFMEDKYKLFLMMLPILVLAFLFSYLPLFGWRYAFYDYKAGDTLSPDKFAGFKWFTQLFQNAATKKDMLRVIKNTLAMSGLGILTSAVPMIFAIFLSEIKNNTFRRFVQTFTTIPNFISWVLVYAIALAIFSTDGFINTFLKSIGNPVTTNYLMDSSHMWLKMLAWGMWKGLGWSAIIYIAAISGIDQSLFEAATVDGAGRFQKMWYVTVPSLIPTYMVLLLMSIANILTNGMDQYLVFSNAKNAASIEVLDLYVYNLGIGSGLIPLSTVIGMVKSLISVILLFSANGISKAVRGESIV